LIVPPKPKNKLHEFWVTNISNKDIMLGDLRITIRRGESKNLLNSHLIYSLAQLEQSANNGSIKFKSNNIKIRNVPPQVPVAPGIYTAQNGRYSKGLRSNVEIVEKKFEELDIDIKTEEEIFAAQEAEDFVNPPSKEPMKKLNVEDFDETFDDGDIE